MIRKLMPYDEPVVLTFLECEPAINLFMIGDILNHGFDSKTQEVYGEFVDGNLWSVLLNYRKENLLYYSKGGISSDVFQLIKTLDFKFISCAKRFSKFFQDEIKFEKIRDLYFCENKQMIPFEKQDHVRLLTIEGVHDLYTLLDSIDEFDGFYLSEKAFVNKLQSDYFNDSPGEILVYEKDGRIVSTARATAETKMSAMVVSVGTLIEEREKGYASSVMKQLINDYHALGKTLCLFYDNPLAGKIYKRLGFEDIDQWVMHYMKGESEK